MITERFNLQFRAEFFNIFNHAQFLTPSGITGFGPTGAATSSSFGVFLALPAAYWPAVAEIELSRNSYRKTRRETKSTDRVRENARSGSSRFSSQGA